MEGANFLASGLSRYDLRRALTHVKERSSIATETVDLRTVLLFLPQFLLETCDLRWVPSTL